MTPDTVILAPASVARILGLSVSRVIQLNREGHLPAVRDSGGRRLFDPLVVERFRRMRESRRGAGAVTEVEG